MVSPAKFFFHVMPDHFLIYLLLFILLNIHIPPTRMSCIRKGVWSVLFSIVSLEPRIALSVQQMFNKALQGEKWKLGMQLICKYVFIVLFLKLMFLYNQMNVFLEPQLIFHIKLASFYNDPSPCQQTFPTGRVEPGRCWALPFCRFSFSPLHLRSCWFILSSLQLTSFANIAILIYLQHYVATVFIFYISTLLF